MNNTLYVTTFNKKLYDFSGHRLLESFLKYQNNEIFCGTENITVDFNDPRIIAYDLNVDPWLEEWTRTNADIIPKKYGGNRSSSWQAIINKYGTDFNAQAARFFRKVAALKKAHDSHKDSYQYLILIDCDTQFLRDVPQKFLVDLFGMSDIIYQLGSQRLKLGTGIEAGFIGFQKKGNQFRFLDILFDVYSTGKFRKYERWDDGFIYRKIVEEYSDLITKDIVNLPTSGYGAHTVQASPLSKYFIHKKGVHQKFNII